MPPAPIRPTIPLGILNQIDIRVGTIESVSDITGSDKLVALRVNFGDHSRTIVAGLKQEGSEPREIEGRQALFVVNVRRQH
jgi:tRNA-binding protein